MKGGVTEKQQQLKRNRELASKTLEARLGRRPQQRDVMTLVMIRRDPAKTRSENGFLRSLAEKYKGLRVRKTRKYIPKKGKEGEKTREIKDIRKTIETRKTRKPIVSPPVQAPEQAPEQVPEQIPEPLEQPLEPQKQVSEPQKQVSELDRRERPNAMNYM
jgi:hypothetical protein